MPPTTRLRHSVPGAHNACPVSGPGGWDNPTTQQHTHKWCCLLWQGHTHHHTLQHRTACSNRPHPPGDQPPTPPCPATSPAQQRPPPPAGHSHKEQPLQQAGPCSSPSCYLLPGAPRSHTLSHTHSCAPSTTRRGRPGRRRPCRPHRRPGRRRPRRAWP